MKLFTCEIPVEGLPYYRTEYTFLPLYNTRENFVRAAAEFFVQSWMSSELPRMIDVWKNWESASAEDRQQYLLYFDHLFSDDGILMDDPSKGVGETDAMATFSETMLRWLREHPSQIIVDPQVPLPPGHGDIDFIEISGRSNDFASLQLTMWEVKSSDSQANAHNNKIYGQLKNYPRRGIKVANSRPGEKRFQAIPHSSHKKSTSRIKAAK